MNRLCVWIFKTALKGHLTINIITSDFKFCLLSLLASPSPFTPLTPRYTHVRTCVCVCVCVHAREREGVVCEEYDIMTRYYFCFDVVKRGVLTIVAAL